MKIRQLVNTWEKQATGKLTEETYSINLPVEDAARIQALREMYPRRQINDLITDLITAALDELESSLPYVKGNQVVAMDEEGDPLYQDIGPTPKFLKLKKKHMQSLQHQDLNSH